MQSTSNTPESNRMRQTNLNRYRNIIPIQHLGYIDRQKISRNIRILLLNLKGINPWNEYKMNLLKEAIYKYQVDVLLLNEIQSK